MEDEVLNVGMILNNVDPSLLIFARLSKVDGQVDETELELLQATIDALGADCSVAELLDGCVEYGIEQLCDKITKEADRFFVRYRSHAMVEVDGDVCQAEQDLLDRIICLLPLSENLEQLLEDTIRAEESNSEFDIAAVEALYAQSSFA